MTLDMRFYKLPKEIAGRKDISASAKIVFTVLMDRIGQNEYCWPGIRCLAKDCGLNLKTAFRAIKHLEARELLRVRRRENGQSNLYYLSECSKFYNRCSQNENGGVPKKGTEAFPKGEHNQKDQLNQTHIYNCPNSFAKADSQSFKLAQLLLDLILARKADFKRPNLLSWASHIERMVKIDKRKPERIEAVIRWCQSDPFEQVNILSTEKLRKRFDQLEMKMANKYVRQRTRYNRDFAGQESSIGTVIQM